MVTRKYSLAEFKYTTSHHVFINAQDKDNLFIQVDAPFETIRYCGLNGEITVYSVDYLNGFEW